jgi:hypothetical protein
MSSLAQGKEFQGLRLQDTERAAVPPDVRKVYDLPVCSNNFWLRPLIE